MFHILFVLRECVQKVVHSVVEVYLTEQGFEEYFLISITDAKG